MQYFKIFSTPLITLGVNDVYKFCVEDLLSNNPPLLLLDLFSLLACLLSSNKCEINNTVSLSQMYVH